MIEGLESQFSLPDQLIDKIYELSGDSDKYKGLVLAVASEEGTPVLYTRFDSMITKFALIKVLEDWAKHESGMAKPTDTPDDL